MRMKFMRILPLTWASTRWPFSSSTRNIALGSGSTTVPSTSIASSFAMASPSGRADAVAVEGGENLGVRVRHRDGVLEVRGQAAVRSHCRPAVVQDAHIIVAHG